MNANHSSGITEFVKRANNKQQQKRRKKERMKKKKMKNRNKKKEVLFICTSRLTPFSFNNAFKELTIVMRVFHNKLIV